MYVCTLRDGLFYATAINSANPVLEKLSCYPFRAPQRVFFNPYNPGDVWVTSYGNGLRRGTSSPSIGISDKEETAAASFFYPNPLAGPINFNDPPEPGVVTVRNMAGNLVAVMNVMVGADLSFLPPGIYQLTIERNGKRNSGKFILTK